MCIRDRVYLFRLAPLPRADGGAAAQAAEPVPAMRRRALPGALRVRDDGRRRDGRVHEALPLSLYAGASRAAVLRKFSTEPLICRPFHYRRMSRWPAVFSSIIYDVPPLQSITPPKGTRRTPGRPQAVLQCNSGEQGYRAIRFCMEELCGSSSIENRIHIYQ